MLLPLQGVSPLLFFTQGDALGYVLIAPSGRCRANADSLILDYKNNSGHLLVILQELTPCKITDTLIQ
jgi:hypothetical protein